MAKNSINKLFFFPGLLTFRYSYLMYFSDVETPFHFQVENPNRETERTYYESVVLSRMARMKENLDQEVAKEKVAEDLENCLGKYKGEYERLVQEIREYEKTLDGKMGKIQREIDSLNKRLIEIDQGACDARNTIGHSGDTLVQCLVEVRSLAKAVNDGTTAYTPLVGVLKG